MMADMKATPSPRTALLPVASSNFSGSQKAVAMSMEDADQIVVHMKGDPRDAFETARGTGMRPKEVFSMRWEYFVWAQLYYHNPKGKTKSARRVVPLLGKSFEILQRRHLAAGSPKEGWVFPSAKAKSGHTMSIAKAYTKARKAAGLPDAMVLYTARHGVGTDLGGVVSLKTVMEVLGHSDARRRCVTSIRTCSSCNKSLNLPAQAGG